MSRQCPTLPRRCQRSTIGARGLNYRVRNGNGCDPSAMVAGKLRMSKRRAFYDEDRGGRKGSRRDGLQKVILNPTPSEKPPSLISPPWMMYRSEGLSVSA